MDQWAYGQMINAMEVVSSGKSGVNEVAYGVPLTNLKDRISGRVKHNTNPSPQKHLSCQEEKKFLTAVGYKRCAKYCRVLC